MSNTTVNGRRLTWRELCNNEQRQVARLSKYRDFVEDLDRCVHGRHSIDPCFSCPGGQSAGNVALLANSPEELAIGNTMSGKIYVLRAKGRELVVRTVDRKTGEVIDHELGTVR